jgi:hypothetical protein
VVTPGAKPIMFFTIMALVNRGDEVIYPNPGSRSTSRWSTSSVRAGADPAARGERVRFDLRCSSAGSPIARS